MLIPSSQDKQKFTEALWIQFEKVMGLWKRREPDMAIPHSIWKSCQVARRIALRHNAGDLRHTEEEMRHEQDVAQFLVEKWAELHGQSCPEIKFGPHH